MSRILGRIATLVAPVAIALALLTSNATTAHAASAPSFNDDRQIITTSLRDTGHTYTAGVKGATWGNGPYVGVRFSRTKTEYLYDGVIGESVFAGVGVLCGQLTRAPYGWAFATGCVVVMTARYTQMKNALADAHDDKKCFEARHFVAGYNPFTNPFKSMTCKEHY